MADHCHNAALHMHRNLALPPKFILPYGHYTT